MSAVLPSLEARREKALENFLVHGMPHRRIEDWKYSNLRAMLDAGQVAQAGSAQWRVEALPEGVELYDLSALSEASPGWVTRNLGSLGDGSTMEEASLAYAKGGVAMRVARGVAVTAPVTLQFFSAGNSRVLVVLEDGASLTLMEANASDAGSVRNIGTEIVLGADAKFSHVRLAASAPKSVEFEHIAAVLARGARYRGHFTSFGGKLARTELHIALKGEGSQAHLSGVNILGGETHADMTTHIDHAVGHTQSTQLFKNVAGGKSHAIYQGRITVREGANGSDSRQTAKALLMGARAEADLKPELEIFADDVKCAHGAAVGDLDADSLFYLRSRGIPDREARNMLVRAFLEEAVAEIDDEAIRAAVWRDVEKVLPHAMEVYP